VCRPVRTWPLWLQHHQHSGSTPAIHHNITHTVLINIALINIVLINMVLINMVVIHMVLINMVLINTVTRQSSIKYSENYMLCRIVISYTL
jgi:hypothetical protein